MRVATMRGSVFAIALGFATALGCLGAASARAEEEPAGEPVKWDQARVTKYAVDLNAAVGEAVQAMRESPIQNQAAQRIVWYELKEDLRLISNSSGHLQAELQAGEGADETRATFDRIGSLRRNAEEHGRKSMIPEPVMAALIKAGAVHNLMKPYYHGKR